MKNNSASSSSICGRLVNERSQQRRCHTPCSLVLAFSISCPFLCVSCPCLLSVVIHSSCYPFPLTRTCSSFHSTCQCIYIRLFALFPCQIVLRTFLFCVSAPFVPCFVGSAFSSASDCLLYQVCFLAYWIFILGLCFVPLPVWTAFPCLDFCL